MNTATALGVSVALGYLATMIIGATELVNRIFDRDWRAAIKIIVAVLVGGFAGALLFKQVGFALGVVTGLSGAGVITGLQKIGTGSSTAPTTPKE